MGRKENGGYEEASYSIDGASGTAAVWKDWGFQGEIFGKSEYWAIEVKTDTPKNASGGDEWGSIDFIIGDKESLRIRVNGTTFFGIYARQNGSPAEFYPSGHNEFYAAYVDGSSDDRKAHAAAIAGGANAFTCVRNGDTVMLFIGNELIFTTEYKFNRTAGENWFGVAAVADGSSDKAAMPTNDTKFIVGQDKINALLASKQATITCDKVTIDEKVYYIGDTVTLTAAAASDGQIFSHFTVDGERISGNTFTVTKAEHAVAAVYTTISTVTVAENVAIKGVEPTEAGGHTYELARGATVTLEYTGVGYIAYFTADSVKLNANTFTASGSAHTIGIEPLTAADSMHWTDFEANDVTDFQGWVNFCKTGESAEDWVIEYTVTKDFTSGSLGVYIGGEHWVEIEIGAEKKLHGCVGGSDYWTKAADLSDEVIAKLQTAGTKNVTVTWIRKGNTLTVIIDKTLVMVLGTFDFGNNHTGAQEFGTMYRNATKDMIGSIRYVTGSENVEAFLPSATQE